ncbi:cephamycin export protein cmcT [Hymenopellis radicata]|nr:cephamycin export protein cmcT [Hymenopellis radicata]
MSTTVQTTSSNGQASTTPQSTSSPAGPTDQTNYVPRRKIITIFLACATVSITGLLDETMIAVALPIIGSELGGGNQIGWVATSFFITSTAFQLTYGRLSDIWSRKTVLYGLMFIFFIGNLGSAFATSFIQLLVFRAIAGIGGGGMPTIGQVIVSDTVSLRERGKYQGILGISVAFANGVGPLIGGAFAQNSTWRWIFRLLLPMTVFSALCMSLTWGGTDYSWDSAHVLAALCVGFPKYPLLPLYIFRQRIVVGAAITHFINGYLTMVQVFYLPTFYQVAYGYSPVKSAAILLALTVVQTFVSSGSGLIITWTGRYRELILTGWAVWAVGLGLLATLDADSSLGKQIGYSLLTGFGVGQTLQPSLVAVQGAVERRDMAVVTSMRSFVRNLGGTLGLAISGTLVTNVFLSNLRKLDLDQAVYDALAQDPLAARSIGAESALLVSIVDGYRKGFRIVFIILASLAAFAFVISMLLMTHSTLKREDDERLKREAMERLDAKKVQPEQTRESRRRNPVLNVYSGEEGLLDYYDPDKNPPVPVGIYFYRNV